MANGAAAVALPAPRSVHLHLEQTLRSRSTRLSPGQPERRPTGAEGEDGWHHGNRQEPSLAELLDDPIMALLWRRDGLEPPAARILLKSLQAMLHQRSQRR